eukprot:721987-Karenia_brevis.AAC.1
MARHHENDIIADRSPTIPLHSKDVRHAKYVDNFMSISHDPHSCDADNNRLVCALEDKGFKIHEQFGPKTD